MLLIPQLILIELLLSLFRFLGEVEIQFLEYKYSFTPKKAVLEDSYWIRINIVSIKSWGHSYPLEEFFGLTLLNELNF